MSERVDFLIVGGGVPGLLAAHQILLRSPNSRVVLVEASEELGGLYRSFYVPEIEIWVDLGMHVYYETGIDEYDSFIKSLLPEDQWSPMAGNQKDIAGLYWEGALWKSSPYPDLRGRNLAFRFRAFSAIVLRAITTLSDESESFTAEELGVRQFGAYVFRHVLSPILRKLYVADPSKLASIGLKSPELRRVILFGPTLTRFLGLFPGLRSRIAFPDQLLLPFRRVAQAGLYPKATAFGKNVLEPMAIDLKRRGLEIRTGEAVLSLTKQEGGVGAVLGSGNRARGATGKQITAQAVVWCAPLSACASAVGLEAPKTSKGLNPSRNKYFATVLLEGENSLSPLYYFYVYDPRFDTFRVTNYAGYSSVPKVLGNNRFILGVEIWSDVSLGEAEVLDKVQRELSTMGVSNAVTTVIGAWLLPQKAPPHEPTLDNEKWHIELASSLRHHFLDSNFVVTGPFVKPDLFFLQDVLRDLHPSIDELIGKQ